MAEPIEMPFRVWTRVGPKNLAVSSNAAFGYQNYSNLLKSSSSSFALRLITVISLKLMVSRFSEVGNRRS